MTRNTNRVARFIKVLQVLLTVPQREHFCRLQVAEAEVIEKKVCFQTGRVDVRVCARTHTNSLPELNRTPCSERLHRGRLCRALQVGVAVTTLRHLDIF